MQQSRSLNVMETMLISTCPSAETNTIPVGTARVQASFPGITGPLPLTTTRPLVFC